MNKVIVVAHQKGGVGKSTVATNLAVELGKSFPVAVVDLDYQQSTTLFSANRRAAGLSPLDILPVKTRSDMERAVSRDGVIVVDSGGYDSDTNRTALIAADMIITPVGDSPLELHGLIRFAAIMQEIRKHNPIQAHVLLNRVHIFASASLAELFDELGGLPEFDTIETVLRDRADYKKAFGRGRSVVELGGNAAPEMQNLIKEITHGW